MLRMLLVTAVVVASGCATQMSVGQFVNARIDKNPGLKITVDAAGAAAQAYNLGADTAITEAVENPQFKEMLEKAHNLYRQAQSYRVDAQSSTFDARREKIRLVEIREGEATRVPIEGTDTVLVVNATPDYAIVRAVETSRGKTVIQFDHWMRPVIAPEFRDYLIGDQLDVHGVIRAKVKRGDAETPKERPRSNRETAPPPPQKGMPPAQEPY